MLLTYTLVVTLTACYLLYYYVTRTFDYWKSRNVAGPKPVPLFGNLMESALRKKNTAVVFKEAYEQYPNEKVVGMYRMTTPCLLIRDLDVAKYVLVKDFDAFSDRGVSLGEKGLGNNLFHAATDQWRVLRNRFTPMFTSGKLKHMIYLLEERGEKFINYLESRCSTETEYDFHPLFQKYTMATISACAFGMDADTLGDKVSFLVKMDKMLTTPSFIDELDMMFPGALKKLNLDFFPKEVTKFFDQLIARVVKERNDMPSNRRDFMDLMLELRQQGHLNVSKRNDDGTLLSLDLRSDVIAAQAFVFYVAGYETSASTMSFMLYELAKHPEIQNKVIAEVDDVLKKHEGKVTFETLSDLKYMDKVFDETLRMYPIVDPIQRMAQTDYQLPGTDVIVKKGQMVYISTLGIHHDEKYYPEPEKFDPERFSSENSSGRHTCAYIPFGTGPRNCIGKCCSLYYTCFY